MPPAPHTASPQALIAQTARVFGVDPDVLVGRSRTAYVTSARQAAAYVLRLRFQQLSLHEIGTLLGGRDHTTIIHALKAVANRTRCDPAYAAQVRILSHPDPAATCLSEHGVARHETT